MALANSQTEMPSTVRLAVDAALAVGLVMLLAGVYALDVQAPNTVAQQPDPIVPPPVDEPVEEPPPPMPVLEMPKESLPPADPVPRIELNYRGDMRFGVTTTSGNPDEPNDDGKQLTFAKDGSTNNTRLWVDGATPTVGESEGQLKQPMQKTDDGRIQGAWTYGDVDVSLTLELVAGDVSRRTDGVQVDYRMTNTGSVPHDVGLRVMLDSLIGGNDGVPFIIPGQEQILTEPQALRGEQLPDFVRALEAADLVSPGVIADMSLRPEQGDFPDEVWLTHWPGGSASWDYDQTHSFSQDTAIGLVYKPRALAPGDSRLVRFTYGLGTISSTQSKNANLSLTAGGPFRAGGQFWVVALVRNPRDGQQVQMQLPPGLKLVAGHDATKTVPATGDYTQLSWLVEAATDTFGSTELKAVLQPEGIVEVQAINIQPPNARLALVPKGPYRSGKPFWVVAVVQHAREGQSVELTLPDGVELAEGHAATKQLTSQQGYTQVPWLIQVPARTSGPVTLGVRLLPDQIEQQATVEIRAGTLIDN